MHGAWEFNIVISNGMVLLAGVVSIALIGRSPTLGGQVAAVALTAISLLTKEVGLVIAWVFLIAHLLRMGGGGVVAWVEWVAGVAAAGWVVSGGGGVAWWVAAVAAWVGGWVVEWLVGG